MGIFDSPRRVHLSPIDTPNTIERQLFPRIHQKQHGSPYIPKSKLTTQAIEFSLASATASLSLSASNASTTSLSSTSSSSSSSPKKGRGDRFIPCGSNSGFKAHSEARSDADSASNSARTDSNSEEPDSNPRTSVGSTSSGASTEYRQSVAEACGISLNQRILEYQPAAPEAKYQDLRTVYNRPSTAHSAQMRRKVSTCPEKALDAPGIIDDYYLNVLDWSKTNCVVIGLENAVYVWDASNGSVSTVTRSAATGADGYVSSLKWINDGDYLSVGTSDGTIQIWDVEAGKKIRTMQTQTLRVGALSWAAPLVTSGSRDGTIQNHDVRIADHKVSEFLNHTGEICGLSWRQDGLKLASGGNDNLVNIWDSRTTTPAFTKTNHKAAVKAVAWCPWQSSLLATGGGTQDKCIHFWNASSGARVNTINTGSQVTALHWSTTYKEIVSAHGFPNNYLTIWSYPSLTRNVDIKAHDSRILYSCLSPDAQTLATCSSDENIKFWKIFENYKKTIEHGTSSGLNKDINRRMLIR